MNNLFMHHKHSFWNLSEVRCSEYEFIHASKAQILNFFIRQKFSLKSQIFSSAKSLHSKLFYQSKAQDWNFNRSQKAQNTNFKIEVAEFSISEKLGSCLLKFGPYISIFFYCFIDFHLFTFVFIFLFVRTFVSFMFIK